MGVLRVKEFSEGNGVSTYPLVFTLSTFIHTEGDELPERLFVNVLTFWAVAESETDKSKTWLPKGLVYEHGATLELEASPLGSSWAQVCRVGKQGKNVLT